MYEHSDKRDRQYGTLDQIRSDHIRRYMLAASLIPAGQRVLDLACGCGYGSWLMHAAGLNVMGIDVSEEAIDYAMRNYPGPHYLRESAENVKAEVDALVTFETLEHIQDPAALLRNVRAKILIASVPNEDVMPFRKEKFAEDAYPHLRHYTPAEFESLLSEGGYKVDRMCCQKDKHGMIIDGTEGMFLIAVART